MVQCGEPNGAQRSYCLLSLMTAQLQENVSYQRDTRYEATDKLYILTDTKEW